MQVSNSLADFMSHLDAGPRGLEDARARVAECAAARADVLDLQQMSLTDGDLAALLPALPAVGEHVTELNLFLNDLTVLPAGLNVLRNLRTLRAGANALTLIAPGLLSSLPSLEELDVGFSETLASLPDDFAHLSALRVLWAGNGRLTSLPESLFACTSLEELHAPGNCLSSLSPSVGRLGKLRVLNVGRNQIERLPDQLAECRRLTKLFVYENCLKRLPKGLGKVDALEELVCAFNPLPDLPGEVRERACAREAAKFLAGSC